jgi:long-chain acyl-CoA synthetase
MPAHAQGVMLSHAAVIAEVAGLQAFLKQIPAGITIDEHDAMLSYLPLAHIFDRRGAWQDS